MTPLQLTILISVAVLAQLTIFAAVVFYRHWHSFTELKRRLAIWEGHSENNLPVPKISLPSTDKPAWTDLREFRVDRKIIENKQQTLCSFYLVPVDGKPLPAFKPGQYLTFHLPSADPNKPLIRCYSLSDKPHPDHYRVTIKKEPSGRGSTFFHEQVQVGDILKVKAPAGQFYLDTAETGPIVLIGSGVGITPVLSMLNTSLGHSPQRPIWFYYGVRNGEEAIMQEHLNTLATQYPNLHLYLCHSQPKAHEIQGTDYHHAGRIDITLLRLTLPLKPHHFYVCGPQAMMDTLIPNLKDWGVPDLHIHYESFGPASPTQSSSPSKHSQSSSDLTVTFSTSGKTVPWQPESASLLEFAEGQGIRVDFGCRAGACGCCTTTLESGEVTYTRTPEAEVNSNTCLLCISIPKTHVTLKA